MRVLWLGMCVVSVCACGVKRATDATRAAASEKPPASCPGTRYVSVYNSSRFSVDVFAGHPNPQLLGTVDQGRGDEFRLPTGATYASTRTTAASPTASGAGSGSVRVMYSCRR